MALCPKCGSQVADGVSVCGVCRAPMEGVAGNSTAIPPQASSSGQGGIAPNVAGLLTYIPLCFIGLICSILFGFVLDPYKNDRFIRFHAWQSLAVHALVVVIGIGTMIFSAVLAVIPIIHFLTILLIPLYLLLGLAGIILMIVLMVKAYGNETFKLPLIGDWAEQQANR